jgi:hypothetical protein
MAVVDAVGASPEQASWSIEQSSAMSAAWASVDRFVAFPEF